MQKVEKIAYWVNAHAIVDLVATALEEDGPNALSHITSV